MPYKFETDKKLINKEDDRRRKLSDNQKKLMVDMYKSGEYSQRKLAIEFGVSRRLVQFIVDPDKQRLNYERRLENGGSKQYYDKDKHTDAIREHRRYKKELNKQNKLKDKYEL